ncbi:MAG: PilW family protein [Kangiella sp.]|nr:PilW family protein [Kangiella sp.]
MIKIKSAKHQGGFTLVELMIGMVLGLILIAGIFTVYIATKRTNNTTEGVITAQSGAQLALSFMKEDIARTGWVNNTALAYTLPSPLTADYATLDGGIGSDTLKVQYESCDASSPLNECDANNIDIADCNGVAVAPGSIITNVYALSADNELTCNGQPLIDNVTDFQVLYGELTPTGLQYVTANNISDSSKIHSIRFGILVTSDHETSDSNISRTINLLDQTINVNDKKLHLKYESTVVVYNRPHGI